MWNIRCSYVNSPLICYEVELALDCWVLGPSTVDHMWPAFFYDSAVLPFWRALASPLAGGCIDWMVGQPIADVGHMADVNWFLAILEVHVLSEEER